MQSFKDTELLETLQGKKGELLRAMREDATHHIIGVFPTKGSEVTINGLIFIVDRINDQAGWMRLVIKKPKESNEPRPQ